MDTKSKFPIKLGRPYSKLVELIRSGRALAFAGAGVTKPLGYPTWPELIDRLAQRVRETRGENIESNGQAITVQQVLREYKDSPLVQAQVLKDNLDADYFELMAQAAQTFRCHPS